MSRALCPEAEGQAVPAAGSAPQPCPPTPCCPRGLGHSPVLSVPQRLRPSSGGDAVISPAGLPRGWSVGMERPHGILSSADASHVRATATVAQGIGVCSHQSARSLWPGWCLVTAGSWRSPRFIVPSGVSRPFSSKKAEALGGGVPFSRTPAGPGVRGTRSPVACLASPAPSSSLQGPGLDDHLPPPRLPSPFSQPAACFWSAPVPSSRVGTG